MDGRLRRGSLRGKGYPSYTDLTRFILKIELGNQIPRLKSEELDQMLRAEILAKLTSRIFGKTG